MRNEFRTPPRGAFASGTIMRDEQNTQVARLSYKFQRLRERLRTAIAKFNPTLPPDVRAEVLAKLAQTETPALVHENRRLHRFLVEGVPVEVKRDDGSIGGEQVRLIDFDDGLHGKGFEIKNPNAQSTCGCGKSFN